MKSKSTIRKLPHQPVTRKLAHWQRDYANLGRRLNTILAEVSQAEFELVALRKATEGEHDCPWRRHMERAGEKRTECAQGEVL